MSDDDFDDDDEAPPERTVTLKRSEIRALEKKAKERDDFATKLEKFERESTFRAAGLDPSNARHARFIKGYDGELDAEAIKTTAIAEEFLEAPAAASTALSPELASDAEVLERMERNAAYGGPPPAGTEAVVEKLTSGSLSETEFWREAQAAGLT